MKHPEILSSRALFLLRACVGVLIGVHAYARIVNWNVADLGAFLTSQGFPLGAVLAWCVTLFEMIGSVCLVSGRFVVGGGRNGAEYSVLLIGALIAVWLATPAATTGAANTALRADSAAS